MVLINDYTAQVKARLLHRHTLCAVALVCNKSDVKAAVLAVFRSVKPNTGSEGCERNLVPRTGRSDASRLKAELRDYRNLTGGELFFFAV